MAKKKKKDAEKPKEAAAKAEKARKTATKAEMAALARQVRAAYRRSVHGMVKAGELLRGFEEQAVAKTFKTFIEDHVRWSRTQVYRLMWLHDQYHDCPKLERYDLSALYVLSAPGCPKGAREEASQKVDAGEHITLTVARDLVAKHSPAANPGKADPARTRSLRVSRAALQKAADERGVDLDKVRAVLLDVRINLMWEEQGNGGEEV